MMRVVPWPRVRGKEVHTNGYMEEALGLTPLIAGWCHEGFYLPFGSGAAAKAALERRLAEINWRRVQSVVNEFQVRMGAGVVCITDHSVRFVTERRFQLLLRTCLYKVPKERFKHAVEKARRQYPSKANVSGNLAWS